MQREYINISLASNIKATARRLADERGQTLSGLISALIFEKGEESLPEQPESAGVKPVGRPRHTAEDKQIARWIERAERFPTYWREELAGIEGLFDGMFGELQAKLEKAIEERDAPTLKELAQGHEWEEVREEYWKKAEEEDRNVNS